MLKIDGMVNVCAKYITVRTAKASGRIVPGDKAFDVVETGTCINRVIYLGRCPRYLPFPPTWTI